MNSNSLWEANLRVIESQYPGLAGQLLQPRSAEPALSDDEIQLEQAVSGAPTLLIRGIHIHSMRDPVREGRRLGEAPGDGPVIVLGFGLGYVAEAIAETVGNRPIILVERRVEILKKALECRDLRNFLTKYRILFVLGGSGEGITGALRLLEGKTGETKPTLVRNRPLMSLDEEWYAAVERRINTWSAREDVNVATLRRFGKRWVRNLAANREAIRDLPGVSRLEGCLAPLSVPVLLVAAGPSLDEIAPLLPELAERAVIVGVDTSLRLLLEQGVDPDFAVAVDPQFWNARHLDRARAAHTCLIAESAVYPPVLHWNHRNTDGSLPFARAFLCASLFPLGRFIEERLDPKGALGAGGSVATTAWDFARILGSREIWIAGLDLSFPNLKTHFRGALFESRSLAESIRFNPAETWSARALRDGRPFKAPAASGGEVLTDSRLALYSSWFESKFRQYPDLHNRSLSPGGLAIPGLSAARAEELLALPPRRAEINRLLQSVFAKIEGEFNAPEEREKRLARYEEAYKTLTRGLERVKALAKEAAALSSKAAGGRTGSDRRPESADRDRVLKRLGELNRLIMESEVKDVAGFLFPPLSELETGLLTPESDPFARHLELSAKLYGSLAETAGYNLEYLQ
ncbi:conserved hypothetical protein [Treponema primitia ZAS-2]|uniref:6-hydroxymethylpterin diphosphokinase MptE-like domain-containing protein n=1 Tax=Treponema primitia (strain ATCC BAA-887 / DSM 12427 / ZAS-2) TaxID=545694 RepID=F5YIJ5_TREPZ|nr:6-hydroxymethylpterin diphosphokinase MptE-like protein [Treponema primitia]AEF86295.1 conserved hypothetical protein [Treponema primitia ZAS-2]